MICNMLWDRRLIILPSILSISDIKISPEMLVIIVEIIQQYLKQMKENRENRRKTVEDEGWEFIELYYKK
jgi:hypothetical protein